MDERGPGVALASPQGRAVVAATVAGSSVAFLDASVVTVALPALGRDLDADLAVLQWTVNAYTLTLAALVLLGGSLGDRYGRRRVFTTGVVWFALASAACALAPTAEALVAARALQGVGGALLTPMSLAILQTSLREADRARAIGLWSGATTLATVAAPVVGGALVALDWRWVFALNLPLAAVTAVLAQRHVPETRGRPAEAPLDAAGAVLCVLALGALTWALTAAPDQGASPGVLGAAGLAVLAGAGFVVRERTAREALVPPALFADRTFTAANAYTLVVYAALAGSGLLVTLQLQVSLGWSALAAGAATLPSSLLLGVLAGRAGTAGERVGARTMLTAGALVAAAGFALLAAASPGDRYASAVLPGVVLMGLGIAGFVAPLTSTVLGAAPSALAGAASGVNNAVARTAGLLAVAALPALAGISGRAYTDPAVLTPGYRSAMLLCAGLLVAGAALALAGLARRPPAAAPRAAARRAEREDPPATGAGADAGGR